MIKVDNVEVFNFEGAIRGLRNPMNSWDKSDTIHGTLYKLYDGSEITTKDGFSLGNNDLSLMKRLYKAGTEHRKYARQIFVSMDITAPLYWWKEFDTYKVGTVSNSCSTMHKIHAKEFTLDDFSHEHLEEQSTRYLEELIKWLNCNREDFINSKDKNDWWQLIQLLPSSYNQRRTITMTYENVFSMIKQRENHKLDEWNDLVDILRTLPYVEDIIN